MAAISYEAGYAHNQLGEFDVALRHYDAALKRDPDMVAARYDRGELHLIRDDLDEAADDFLSMWSGSSQLTLGWSLSPGPHRGSDPGPGPV